MIDSHCHIDLYDSPLEIAKVAEARQITTVAVTYLPSHFQMAEQHLHSFQYVRPALGMHPLSAKDHRKELSLFRRLAADANLIGEIGLDFSASAKSTRVIQEESFCAVLDCLREKKCFITLHSRQAEDAVLRHVQEAGIKRCVFHWFSGTRAQLTRILETGHLVSINTAMIKTAKWQDFIKFVPREQILTESDGPFVRTGNIPATPNDMISVLNWLASKWEASLPAVEGQVRSTFASLIPPKAIATSKSERLGGA